MDAHDRSTSAYVNNVSIKATFLAAQAQLMEGAFYHTFEGAGRILLCKTGQICQLTSKTAA
jgi:hypothetical protein